MQRHAPFAPRELFSHTNPRPGESRASGPRPSRRWRGTLQDNLHRGSFFAWFSRVVAVADRVFEAAGRLYDIELAVWVQRDMPEMPRAAKLSAEQAAIDNRRPAHAGAEREHEDVVTSFGRAVPSFAEQCGVSIVQNAH